MNDWVRFAERDVIYAKAMLTQAYRIEETVEIIRYSRDKEDAAKKLMDVLGLDEIGARFVAGEKLSHLVGIRPDNCKESIEFFEKRLSNVRELAKYDR
jgi:DNA gyrase/topoisomerase IV subunit A